MNIIESGQEDNFFSCAVISHSIWLDPVNKDKHLVIHIWKYHSTWYWEIEEK